MKRSTVQLCSVMGSYVVALSTVKSLTALYVLHLPMHDDVEISFFSYTIIEVKWLFIDPLLHFALISEYWH